MIPSSQDRAAMPAGLPICESACVSGETDGPATSTAVQRTVVPLVIIDIHDGRRRRSIGACPA
jgi:hypothetical protein